MDSTPRFSLPMIMAAQAQKHITHNEALVRIEALLPGSVISRTVDPSSITPSESDTYLVPPGAGAEFVTHENELAIFNGTSWEFQAPEKGTQILVEDSAQVIVWDGLSWQQFGGDQSTPQILGVNTSADSKTRLAVESDNVRLTSETGDIRLYLNRLQSNGTSSAIFQSTDSGRAEIGLAGTDDFTIRVSDDGEQWRDTMQINSLSGVANFNYLPTFADFPAFDIFRSSTSMLTSSHYAFDFPLGTVVTSNSTNTSFESLNTHISEQRTSPIGCFDNGGNFTNVPVETLPIAHDSRTKSVLGLLLQPESKNVFRHSADPTGGTWTTARLDVSAAPDQSSPFEQIPYFLLPSASNGSHYLLTSAESAIADNTLVTCSLLVRPNGLKCVRLLLGPSSAFGTTPSAYFDLEAGIAINTQGLSSPAQIEKVSGGWFRVSISTTVSSSATVAMALYLCSDNLATSFSGDGVSGVHFSGAQLETNAAPTAFLETQSSSVTSTANEATIDLTASGFDLEQGTIVIEGHSPLSTAGATKILSLRDSSETQADIVINRNTVNALEVYHNEILASSVSLPTVDDHVTFALSWFDGGIVLGSELGSTETDYLPLLSNAPTQLKLSALPTDTSASAASPFTFKRIEASPSATDATTMRRYFGG